MRDELPKDIGKAIIFAALGLSAGIYPNLAGNSSVSADYATLETKYEALQERMEKVEAHLKEQEQHAGKDYRDSQEEKFKNIIDRMDRKDRNDRYYNPNPELR